MPHNKHGLACKSHTCAAHKHGIPCMDRYRSGTDGHPRNIGIPRTGLVCKDIFHLHTDSFSHRAQNGRVIKKLLRLSPFLPLSFSKAFRNSLKAVLQLFKQFPGCSNIAGVSPSVSPAIMEWAAGHLMHGSANTYSKLLIINNIIPVV